MNLAPNNIRPHIWYHWSDRAVRQAALSIDDIACPLFVSLCSRSTFISPVAPAPVSFFEWGFWALSLASSQLFPCKVAAVPTQSGSSKGILCSPSVSSIVSAENGRNGTFLSILSTLSTISRTQTWLVQSTWFPGWAELGHSVFRREILVEAVQIRRLAHPPRRPLCRKENPNQRRARWQTTSQKWNVIVLFRILTLKILASCEFVSQRNFRTRWYPNVFLQQGF